MKYAIVILFLSAGYSIAADDEASKKLLKDLEGAYRLASCEIRGEPMPADFIDPIEKVSIKGDKFTMHRIEKDGSKTTSVFAITVDAAKKPAHINMKADDGDNKNKTALGIVSKDGETIKICLGDFGAKKRHALFKASVDDENSLMTLKKMKE